MPVDEFTYQVFLREHHTHQGPVKFNYRLADSNKSKPLRTKPPMVMPPGVQRVEHEVGRRDLIAYQTDDGEWHSQEEAREMGITHSTLPTPSKEKKDK